MYKSACSGSYVLVGVMLSDLIKIVSGMPLVEYAKGGNDDTDNLNKI